MPESLSAPPQGALPEGSVYDSQQERIIALSISQHAVILGAPGSGKTTALQQLITRLISTAELSDTSLVVLTPDRRSASRLRDELGVMANVPLGGALARSFNSLAFQIVSERNLAEGRAAPNLLTGPDQDDLISGILRGDTELDLEWPAPLTDEVTALQRFRTELRSLLAQLVDHGVRPEQLATLAQQAAEPLWHTIAQFARHYEQQCASQWPEHYGSAELLAEAAQIVSEADHHDFRVPAASSLRLVIVDDAQELTWGEMRLLRSFQQRGVKLILSGDPDIAASGFRYGIPEILGAFETFFDQPATRIVMPQVYRHSASLRTLVQKVAERTGTAQAGEQRRATATVGDAPTAVQTRLCASSAEETALIAAELKRAVLSNGRRWQDIAVVARNRTQIEQLSRGLAAAGIPVRFSAAQHIINRDPTVRALLTVAKLLLTGEPPSYQQSVELLTGPLCGLTQLELRRIRREILLALGETEEPLRLRVLEEQITELLGPPSEPTLLAADVLPKKLQRFQKLLHSVPEPRALSAAELLWSIWKNSGLESGLVQELTRPGTKAELADRTLDLVTAAFAAAARFVERFPEGSARELIEQLLGSDLPEDTLAYRIEPDAVLLATPADLISREFELVVVAGVEEGVWPNLGLRGGLLKIPELLKFLRGVEPDAQIDERRAVFSEELRLLNLAVSRAKHRLLITARLSKDDAPSVFFRFAEALASEETAQTADSKAAGVPPAEPLEYPDLSTLTASIRAALALHPEDTFSAEALAILAEAGVTGADPQQWYGVPPISTERPLYDELSEQEGIPLSPSQLESFWECPLHGILGRLGAGRPSAAAGTGTNLHRYFEAAASAQSAEELLQLRQHFEQTWQPEAFEAPWLAELGKDNAALMLQRILDYQQKTLAEGTEVLGSELSFSFRSGQAEVRGVIDRVERIADGSMMVVDLKTGGSEGTTDYRVSENNQLKSYQLALLNDAIEGLDSEQLAGAKLVVVSPRAVAPPRPAAEPKQPRLSSEEAAELMQAISDTAEQFQGPVYFAALDEHCLGQYSFGHCRIHVIGQVSS